MPLRHASLAAGWFRVFTAKPQSDAAPQGSFGHSRNEWTCTCLTEMTLPEHSGEIRDQTAQPTVSSDLPPPPRWSHGEVTTITIHKVPPAPPSKLTSERAWAPKVSAFSAEKPIWLYKSSLCLKPFRYTCICMAD